MFHIKKALDDILKFMKSQSRKFDNLHNDFKDPKILIQEVASHVRGIESFQSIAITQSSEALRKVSINEIIIEIIKQKQLKSCLVFAGIPRLPDEKIMEIIITICANLGVNINEQDISICYRQGHQVRVNSKGVSMPPTIMTEFSREQTKSSILTATKKGKKMLTSSDIGLEVTPPSRIYVNERLTPYNHHILKEALMLKSRESLKYVWTNGGFVHGRVADSAPDLLFNSIEEVYTKLGICHPIPSLESTQSKLNQAPPDLQTVPEAEQHTPSTATSGKPFSEVTSTKRKARDAIASSPTKMTKISPVVPARTRGRSAKEKEKDKEKAPTNPEITTPDVTIDSPSSPSEYLSA